MKLGSSIIWKIWLVRKCTRDAWCNIKGARFVCMLKVNYLYAEVRFIMEENKYFTPIFDVTINKYKDFKIIINYILYYLAFINKNQDYINANKRKMSYLFFLYNNTFYTRLQFCNDCRNNITRYTYDKLFKITSSLNYNNIFGRRLRSLRSDICNVWWIVSKQRMT